MYLAEHKEGKSPPSRAAKQHRMQFTVAIKLLQGDKQEDAPESKDEQTPEFNEVTEKVLQEEELNVIKEETQAEVQEEVQEALIVGYLLQCMG